MYAKGKGVSQDYSLAVQWYKKAAEQGYASAQNNLGVSYCYGEGVEKEYAKAAQWFTKAADQGDMAAAANLAWCCQYGRGVALDYEMAVSLYKKAADKGNAGAANSLGAMYANGIGVQRDYAMAQQWLEQAAALGSSKAAENLAIVRANIEYADSQENAQPQPGPEQHDEKMWEMCASRDPACMVCYESELMAEGWETKGDMENSASSTANVGQTSHSDGASQELGTAKGIVSVVIPLSSAPIATGK